MHSLSFVQTGYSLYDYRLILQPSTSVKNRLELVKQKLKDRYRLQHNQLGYNHLVVASFSQYGHSEDRLVQRLRHAMAGVAPFRIHLSRVCSQPSHSIFLEVPLTPTMQSMLKEVRRHQWLMRAPLHQPYIATNPKFDLAHNLTPLQFEAMWPRLQQRHFTAAFIAEDLLLLRRRKGERNWQILERLTFQNMPVLARQGILF